MPPGEVTSTISMVTLARLLLGFESAVVLVAEVPTIAARAEGWPVVAVDVSIDVPPVGEDDLVLDTMMRTQMMTARLLREQQLRTATGVIRPAVGRARWAEWQRFDEFVEVGRAASREFLGR